MKNLKQYITEKLKITKDNIDIHKKYKYFPKTKEELRQIIKERIKNEGLECNLNDIDVSKITDMSGLFYGSNFTGDISEWDVSNVENMYKMFADSLFDQDISNWTLHKDCCTKYTYLFQDSPIELHQEKWPQNYEK